MLEARNVTGSYGPITAVRNLDFSIQPGSAVALVGRNGAGKSTVLKLLAGVMRPTKGEILWDGECITTRRPTGGCGGGSRWCPKAGTCFRR